jgi:hypothetical protein
MTGGIDINVVMLHAVNLQSQIAGEMHQTAPNPLHLAVASSRRSCSRHMAASFNKPADLVRLPSTRTASCESVFNPVTARDTLLSSAWSSTSRYPMAGSGFL